MNASWRRAGSNEEVSIIEAGKCQGRCPQGVLPPYEGP